MSAPIIAPEVVERMVRIIRTIADCPPAVGIGQYTAAEACRVLVAELPAPVDPEKEEIRKLLAAGGWTPHPDNSDRWSKCAWPAGLALAALKCGRDLERAALANESGS